MADSKYPLRPRADGSGAFEVAFDLEHLLTYHPPKPSQVAHYEAIRAAALRFAAVLLEHTPISADQAVAVRKLRECVMTANASIALEGRLL